MILFHSDEVPLCCTVSQDPSETSFGTCKYLQYFQKWCLTELRWTFLYVYDTAEYNPGNEIKKIISLKCENGFYPNSLFEPAKLLWSPGRWVVFKPYTHTHTNTQFQIHIRNGSTSVLAVQLLSHSTVNEPGNQKPAECVKPTRISLFRPPAKPVASPAWGPVRAAAPAAALPHGKSLCAATVLLYVDKNKPWNN